MAKHYDKQFKIDAVQYYHDHKNLGLCEEMGIPACTVKKCMKETGRLKTVALNYCIKQAENRKNFN